MRSKIFIILGLCFLFILSGCNASVNQNSSSSGITTNSTSTVINQNYNIGDADNLTVLPSTAANQLKLKSMGTRSALLKGSKSSDNTLCKIETNGIMDVVYSISLTVITNNVISGGNVVSTFITTNTITNDVLNPTGIYVVNSNYLIVAFGYSSGYLVRKADGAIFTLANVGVPSGGGSYYSGDIVNSDKNGNIYYITSGVLIQINTQDPNNLVKTTYSISGDTVSSFTVDADGNVAYLGSDAGSNPVMRFKKATGGFALLPGQPNYSFTCSWIGFDGKFYYYNESLPFLQQMYVTNNIVTNINYGGIAVVFNVGVMNLLKMPVKNRIMAFAGSGGSSIYDLYNSSNTVRTLNISTFGLDSMKTEACSDNYYYIVGASGTSPVLKKIDPANDTYTTPISGNYDIYSLSVSSNDIVTFNALQMSDGSKVFGKISNGVVSIIDSNLNVQTTVLQRIR